MDKFVSFILNDITNYTATARDTESTFALKFL